VRGRGEEEALGRRIMHGRREFVGFPCELTGLWVIYYIMFDIFQSLKVILSQMHNLCKEQIESLLNNLRAAAKEGRVLGEDKKWADLVLS
jgi:hypothetical protein